MIDQTFFNFTTSRHYRVTIVYRRRRFLRSLVRRLRALGRDDDRICSVARVDRSRLNALMGEWG